MTATNNETAADVLATNELPAAWRKHADEMSTRDPVSMAHAMVMRQCASQLERAIANAAPPAAEAGEPDLRAQLDALAAGRYKVTPTNAGFWPFAVKAGDGEQELYKGYRNTCDAVARKLTGAFLDGGFAAAALIRTSTLQKESSVTIEHTDTASAAAQSPGPTEEAFERWYETEFKPYMERGPLDKYVARQAWYASRRITATPPASEPDGFYVVRYNDDGEFGQHVGWLYRTGGAPCAISGKPVYVWRPLAELLEKAA